MGNQLYVVTGAAGHLGSVLCTMLVGEGARVRGLVMPGDRCPALAGLDIELVRADVRNFAALAPLFDGVSGSDITVIHAAGIVSITSRGDDDICDVNVGGTQNILAHCIQRRVGRLVYVSSVHAIPEHAGVISETVNFPPDRVQGQYAQTKAAATRAVLEAADEGLCASVVHPSGIIGPGDYGHAHLTQLVLDYLNGRLRAAVRGGYDFVDVRDVAAGTLACARRGAAGECYILSNRYCTVADLLQMLSHVSGRKPVGVTLPMWLAQMTAPLAEAYYRILRQPPLYTSYSLYTLRSDSHFSHAKATEALDYRPRPLEETVADTCAWLREMGRAPC